MILLVVKRAAIGMVCNLEGKPLYFLIHAYPLSVCCFSITEQQMTQARSKTPTFPHLAMVYLLLGQVVAPLG